LNLEGRVEPGGQLDMQQLLQAAAAMQSQLMSAQAELAEAEVEGTAGGGLVTATVNGQGELIDLSIAAAAIEGDDLEETAQTVADLVLAAYRDAVREVDELQQETMAPFAAGFGGGAGLPGMPDLSSFPGFPGLPGAPGQQGPDEPPAEDQDDPASEN
jgi:nucleoid-associated protein EbfC